MDERRYLGEEWAPRLAALLAVAGGVLILWSRDAVAGGVAVVGLAALVGLIRRRARGALRRGLLTLVVGATAVALVGAVGLAVPLRPLRPQGPVLVTPPGPTPPVAPETAPPAAAAATVLGFVAPDYGDVGTVIDRDGPDVTTVAATGITLGPRPGTISVRPAGDALAHAHRNGASALAVVSNYDGTAFDGGRAAAVLASSSARHKLVGALVGELGRRGWDGLVLDLERLPASARVQYPALVAELNRAAGARPVLVAVPARDPDNPGPDDGYDLAALRRAADQIGLIAHDEHPAGAAAGPG